MINLPDVFFCTGTIRCIVFQFSHYFIKSVLVYWSFFTTFHPDELVSYTPKVHRYPRKRRVSYGNKQCHARLHHQCSNYSKRQDKLRHFGQSILVHGCRVEVHLRLLLDSNRLRHDLLRHHQHQQQVNQTAPDAFKSVESSLKHTETWLTTRC